MAYIKSGLVALATVFALSTPVLAQGEGAAPMSNGTVRLFKPDGRMYSRMVTDRPMMDSMVKAGKPIGPGQVVVMSDGKLYIVEDHKMADGKMLSDHIEAMK